MNKLVLDQLLRQALIEDIGQGDITSEAIFSGNHESKGYLIAKRDMVLAGLEVFTRVFSLLDENVKVTLYYVDGDRVQSGQKFAHIQGPTRSLLAGERVALNFLQRLTGIANETNRYVEACGGSGTIIVDTRKTTPGLRMLEKYAVTVGGGKNHRYGLDSMVLIKDNHIKAAGGILTAVQKVRDHISPFIKIEVEVEEMQQVHDALTAGVDVIMLDNMSLPMIEEAVRVINHQALVEVSGNITGEKIAGLASRGVNIISSGALTHSAKAADISMRLE
ncbi:nicotinate-nucleotide pyrophosphorylase [Anaerosporomusa subterranea]|uniref:Probable nicotinate-nucleotide pyrophosphorylase [carboxylating] n=1 Tax=Anaerosporomusa subterranea TaxID=1794912 RepID=A0A154BPR1_ANASB|nr:carboxylating nicotinate-nucleotide diphosphorylase [Anaerosporomusa subterranea]KYZ75488.1 nicotinate-nucleotide pyrophosphorylase [Anaerosporomusa subterranea]